MNVEKLAALEEVRQKNQDGMLMPKEVVASAKDPTSPLHEDFEWDNEACGELYREQQARQLIRAAVTFEPRLQRSVRGFLSVPTDRLSGGGYRPTSEVISRPDLTSQLVEEVRKSISNMRSRYAHLDMLDPLWSRLDMTVEEFLKQRAASAA